MIATSVRRKLLTVERPSIMPAITSLRGATCRDREVDRRRPRYSPHASGFRRRASPQCPPTLIVTRPPVYGCHFPPPIRSRAALCRGGGWYGPDRPRTSVSRDY